MCCRFCIGGLVDCFGSCLLGLLGLCSFGAEFGSGFGWFCYAVIICGFSGLFLLLAYLFEVAFIVHC